MIEPKGKARRRECHFCRAPVERCSEASGEVAGAEPMLNVAQAAWLTGLAESTLRNRRHRERLGVPHYKLTSALNGPIGFRRSELEAWLQKRSCGRLDPSQAGRR